MSPSPRPVDGLIWPAIRRLAFTILLVAVGGLSTGCRLEGIAFMQDDRLTITAPEDYSVVQLPVTLTWEIEGFDVVGPDGSTGTGAGYFGVFVDTSPMPPGQGWEYVAQGDETCLRDPGCPDEKYLKDRDAYPTTGTSFRVDALQDTRPRAQQNGGKSRHDITIVLLDGQSRRIGESAWTSSFFVDRSS